MQRRKFLAATLSAALPFSGYAHTVFSTAHQHLPFKVNAGEARFGTRYTMKGITLNTLDIKISGKDTNAQLAVFEQSGQTPHGGPPLHIHPYQDEWFFITEGAYLFRCGDNQYHLHTGDTIFLPRNIPHAFVQLTEKAKTIVAYMPAGQMEEFFAATSKWINPPSKEDIAKVFAQHGMRVVGEPLQAK